MRQVLLTLTFAVLTICLQAQIVFTSADLPVIGDEITFGVDTLSSIGPGPAGADQTWDFRDLQADQFVSTRYTSPMGTPFEQEFPNATIVGQAIVDTVDAFIYQEYTSEAAFTLGIAIEDSEIGPQFIEFDPPQQDFVFPVSFDAVNQTMSSSELTFTDSVSMSTLLIRSNETRTATTDGYGTLRLPDGDFEVLRQTVETVSVDSSFLVIGPQLIFVTEDTTRGTEYRWLAKEGSGVILSIDSSEFDQSIIANYFIEGSGGGSAPSADFTFTEQETGTFAFSDASTNDPTAWDWDFGDGNSGTEQNPLHAYTNSGTYEVQLIASNAFGADTTVKTVEAVITSVDDLRLARQIELFPVPARDWLQLRLPYLPGEPLQITIMDSQGKELLRENIAGRLTRIELSMLPVGNYFYRIEAADRSIKGGQFLKK